MNHLLAACCCCMLCNVLIVILWTAHTQAARPLVSGSSAANAELTAVELDSSFFKLASDDKAALIVVLKVSFVCNRLKLTRPALTTYTDLTGLTGKARQHRRQQQQQQPA